MKKSFGLLALFIGLSTMCMAQLKQGTVNYTMEMTSDNPEMAMMSGMMAGSTMKLAFAPGKSRSDVNIGMMGKVVTISDDKTKKALSLTDMMGMKYAIKSDVEVPADGAASDQTIEKTSETKDIAGYKCTKVIMRNTDGSELVGWFTKDIAASTNGQKYFNEEMPGFPLEFSIAAEGMVITFVASSVEKKVDKDAFDMKIPEGYEEKTVDELMEMQGQE